MKKNLQLKDNYTKKHIDITFIKKLENRCIKPE